MHTITPGLVVRGAEKAIEFYRQALGAEVNGRPRFTPDGRVMHAQIKIGDSTVMLTDEFPDRDVLSPLSNGGRTSVVLHTYVDDVDAVYARAVQLGATAAMPVFDAFWGDRYGQIVDPFGHCWGLATHLRQMTEDELTKGVRKSVEG